MENSKLKKKMSRDDYFLLNPYVDYKKDKSTSSNSYNSRTEDEVMMVGDDMEGKQDVNAV